MRTWAWSSIKNLLLESAQQQQQQQRNNNNNNNSYTITILRTVIVIIVLILITLLLIIMIFINAGNNCCRRQQSHCSIKPNNYHVVPSFSAGLRAKLNITLPALPMSFLNSIFKIGQQKQGVGSMYSSVEARYGTCSQRQWSRWIGQWVSPKPFGRAEVFGKHKSDMGNMEKQPRGIVATKKENRIVLHQEMFWTWSPPKVTKMIVTFLMWGLLNGLTTFLIIRQIFYCQHSNELKKQIIK